MKLNDLINEGAVIGISDEKKNALLAKFGLGPDYVPPEPSYRVCKSCGYDKAVVKEMHPDTDMNCMVIACSKCGHDEEL